MILTLRWILCVGEYSIRFDLSDIYKTASGPFKPILIRYFLFRVVSDARRISNTDSDVLLD